MGSSIIFTYTFILRFNTLQIQIQILVKQNQNIRFMPRFEPGSLGQMMDATTNSAMSPFLNKFKDLLQLNCAKPV
jgi:hypothetical protein